MLNDDESATLLPSVADLQAGEQTEMEEECIVQRKTRCKEYT